MSRDGAMTAAGLEMSRICAWASQAVESTSEVDSTTQTINDCMDGETNAAHIVVRRETELGIDRPDGMIATTRRDAGSNRPCGR